VRYWDRARDPDKPESRSRSTVSPGIGPAPSQFGQRPMFSVPGEDQPPPEQGVIGTEARLDPVVPTDESEGSKARTDLEGVNLRAGVMMTYSKNDVSNPPTEDQLNEAFGPRPSGWVGFIIDGGGAGVVWFCIKSTSEKWYYELLTKAV